MTSGQKFTAYGSEPVKDVQPHRSILGALRYTTITRIEVTYSVNRVMQAPLETHW